MRLLTMMWIFILCINLCVCLLAIATHSQLGAISYVSIVFSLIGLALSIK